MSQLPVLIVGAGISGLVLAQHLTRLNVPFQIFERDATVDTRDGGWGLTLHKALPALRQLLPADLLARLPETYVNHATTTHSDPGRFPFFDLKSGQALYHIPAAERIRVSRRRLRQLLTHGIDIQWNKSLQRIESTADTVTVHFDDHSSCTGHLLLSCDGAHSPTRHILYPDAALNVLPIHLLGATTDYTTEELHGAQEIDPSIFHGAHPDSNTYLFFSFLETPHLPTKPYHCQLILSWSESTNLTIPPSNTARLALMKSLTDNWAQPFRALIQQLPEQTEVRSIRVADWIFSPDQVREHPRVVLLGDAAHTMTMFRGEGANHAIMDVQDLVSRVDFQGRTWTVAALRDYEREIFTRAVTAVVNSRQACLDAHDFQAILNGSPLVARRN
ncbi:FAD/NAD(P)-binding domain-containing protein [Aspergillus coremiiformis]|uniref:FAD/NAD(P)-binding domain-containing protein n=1 Tax=Aspergillus coremiiformis TaxID=138285 RepID=A0A5N6ZC00_9EURO|nr:FAD/NAD(P)-binding domain-containing protein [Aspergillus coremiiformis]